MMLFVDNIEYVADYKVIITFNNKTKKIADLEDSIFNESSEIFKPLRDVEYFKNFYLDCDTITWKNGLDLAPEFLWEIGKNI